VNIPKTKKSYCKGKACKKHQMHKVTQYKTGKASLYAQGASCSPFTALSAAPAPPPARAAHAATVRDVMVAATQTERSAFSRTQRLSFTTVVVVVVDCVVSGGELMMWRELLTHAGKRRYDRKQSGYGGQTKPVFHKKVRVVCVSHCSSLFGRRFRQRFGTERRLQRETTRADGANALSPLPCRCTG